MGRGGPRSNKPKALRKLQGSRERARHRDRVEPEPAAGRPPKRDGLSAVASQKWDDLVALLEGENRLTVSDGPWLEVTSIAYAEYRRWLELAEKSELTVTDDKGNEKPHPSQQQARLAWESYRKLLAEGGVTPISRARVNAKQNGDDEEDEFTKLQHATQQRPKLRAVK